MAYKPRVIKLDNGGQATLIYMSTDEADKYEKLLTDFNKGEVKDPEAKEIALGKYFNNETKHYELVVIKYNPLTKAAFIDTISEVSGNKQRANDELKKALVKNKILD